MNKVEKLKEKIKNLEKQLQFAKTELMDICPHDKAVLASVSDRSGGFGECNFEWEASDECTLVCLDCGMVIISDDPKHCDLNVGQIVDKPLL